jgi:hypothetical protein
VPFHLAQVNIAVLREPLDHPALAGFVAALDPLNAVADAAPGFVWRLQEADGNATSIQAFEWADEVGQGVITNLSVWQSIEALADFAYGDDHRRILRQRRAWFHPVKAATLALWWIPAGSIPTVDEAEARVAHLRTHGPTPEAFTFRQPFAAPDGSGAGVADDRWSCGV